jgi:hypothetical protein
MGACERRKRSLSEQCKWQCTPPARGACLIEQCHWGQSSVRGYAPCARRPTPNPRSTLDVPPCTLTHASAGWCHDEPRKKNQCPHAACSSRRWHWQRLCLTVRGCVTGTAILKYKSNVALFFFTIAGTYRHHQLPT